MTGLGWTCIGGAILLGVYGFAWALCNAARMGDDALDNLDDQERIDYEFAVLVGPLEEYPYDQERP